MLLPLKRSSVKHGIRDLVLMRKKVLALTLVMALISSFFFYAILVQPVESQSFETIFIRADGSVEGTDKIHQDRRVYSLTDDISGSITVEMDSITIDGANHTLSGRDKTGLGLVLSERYDVIVRNMNIKGFDSGIYLNASSKIRILQNNILNNDIGVLFGGYWIVITNYDWHGTNNISILENTISGNNVGVNLGQFSSWNDISDNNFTHNEMGIQAMVGNSNLIVGNSFVENNGFAIHLSDSRNNTLHHNNFINNKVVDSIQIFANWYVGYNAWDDGYEGNYWSDYVSRYPNATEVDDSGIWNTPFYIKESNIDNHPLMYPWRFPPEIKVLSLGNFTYIGSFPLNFTVNKPSKWMGYSLNGKANVTITGNVTLNGLATGVHNITVYALDNYGIRGASETVIFTIEQQTEPFPTALAATAFGVSVAIIGIGLLVYFKKRKH
jgi:parallel beta-helix repeat protein